MTSTALRRSLLLVLLFSVVGSIPLSGCGQSGKIAFEVKGVSAQENGIFTNNKGFRVTPNNVQLAVGDWHLDEFSPDKELSTFTNLSPLLKPGEEVKSEDIGKDGKFPGLWVVNLMPKAKSTLFPVGSVPMKTWRGIKWRLAPAVSGVRGLSTQEPIYQNTLAMTGSVQKGTVSCNFEMKLAFELGLGSRVNLVVSSPTLQRFTIGVDFSVWFEDVDFSSVCKGSANPVLITNQSHPDLVETLKKNVPGSFRFQFTPSAN